MVEAAHRELKAGIRKTVFLKSILAGIEKNNLPLVHLLVDRFKEREKQQLFLEFDLAKTDEMRFLFLKLSPIVSNGEFTQWLRGKMRYERLSDGSDARIPAEEVIDFLLRFKRRMLMQKVYLFHRHILPINHLVVNNSSTTVMAALLYWALRHPENKKLVSVLTSSNLLNFNYACGVSTLMEAAAFYTTVLPLLLERVAKNEKVSDEQLFALLNAQDIEGNTALHYAVYYEQVNSVVELLKAGANPLAKNNRGMTPRQSIGKPTKPADGKPEKSIFKKFFTKNKTSVIRRKYRFLN